MSKEASQKVTKTGKSDVCYSWILTSPSSIKNEAHKSLSTVAATTTITSPAHDISKESPLGKFLIGAGTAWILEFCAGHQLEFLKISKQTTNLPYWQIFREVSRQEKMYVKRS
jgi:hypothetical protein